MCRRCCRFSLQVGAVVDAAAVVVVVGVAVAVVVVVVSFAVVATRSSLSR